MAKGHSLSLAKCLELVLNERLTKKQKYILGYVYTHGKVNSITSLVKSVSSELKCSESAVWNNVNSLKRCGLIHTNECVKLGRHVESLMEEMKNERRIASG